MKAERKQRNNAGFTLAEMMLAVLILLMVAAIVAGGMPMARRAYEDAVDAANAQTLLSTTATMLRGELSEAKYLSGSGTNALNYLSGSGLRTTLSSEAGSPIHIACGSINEPLVTTEAQTARLHTEFGSISPTYLESPASFLISRESRIAEIKVLNMG